MASAEKPGSRERNCGGESGRIQAARAIDRGSGFYVDKRWYEDSTYKVGLLASASAFQNCSFPRLREQAGEVRCPLVGSERS
jgi:hypothetical protein